MLIINILQISVLGHFRTIYGKLWQSAWFCLFVIDVPDFGTLSHYLCTKKILFPIFISDKILVLSNTLPTRERR